MIIFVLVDDVNRSIFDEDMRENDFYILFLSDLDLTTVTVQRYISTKISGNDFPISRKSEPSEARDRRTDSETDRQTNGEWGARRIVLREGRMHDKLL